MELDVSGSGWSLWVGAEQLTQTKVNQGIIYYNVEVEREKVLQIYTKKQRSVQTAKSEIGGKANLSL